MKSTDLIAAALADGVTLTVSHADTIKAVGEQTAVNRWVPVVREHKTAIIKELLEAGALTGQLDEIRLWLDFIGENDPLIIGNVMDACGKDPDALKYFTWRAKETP